MGRFIFVAFMVLGWAFWELSGGASFVPEEQPIDRTAQVARQEVASIEPVIAFAPPEPIASPAADAAIEAALVEAFSEPLLAPPVAEPVAEPAAEIIADPTTTADLRVVSGDRVNLRDGPGRDFTAIDQLSQGTVAEVLETGADGWARIQVQGSTLTGWVSSDFLSPLNG